MTKFKEKTLASALQAKRLEELPAEWDKKTPFKECIVKIQTKIGDGYFLGRYAPDDKYKYKVTTSFESVGYSRSASDIIYPIGVEQNVAKEESIITAPKDINFANEAEALAWLKERKYRGWQLLKTPEAIKAAVEKILTAEAQQGSGVGVAEPLSKDGEELKIEEDGEDK